MPFSPEVEAARVRVFEAIGRNVLRFQKLELILKAMVEGSQTSLTPSGSTPAHMKRSEALKMKSLGLAAKQLFEEVALGTPLERDDPPLVNASTDEILVSMRVVTHLGPEHHTAWKERLRLLIEERNELIHSSLLKMELGTLAGCEKALSQLQEQGSRALAEIDAFKQLYEQATQTREKLNGLLADDALRDQLISPDRS